MWRCADAHISSHSHTHTHLHSNMSWVHMHVYTIPCTHVYHTQTHTHYKYMHCWRWVGGKEKNETTHYYNHAFSADVLTSWKEKTVQVPGSPEPSVVFTCLSIWLPAEQLDNINIHTHFKKEEKKWGAVSVICLNELTDLTLACIRQFKGSKCFIHVYF